MGLVVDIVNRRSDLKGPSIRVDDAGHESACRRRRILPRQQRNGSQSSLIVILSTGSCRCDFLGQSTKILAASLDAVP